MHNPIFVASAFELDNIKSTKEEIVPVVKEEIKSKRKEKPLDEDEFPEPSHSEFASESENQKQLPMADRLTNRQLHLIIKAKT